MVAVKKTIQKNYNKKTKHPQLSIHRIVIVEQDYVFVKIKIRVLTKKTINTLTKEKEIIIELIDKIEDPKIKLEYLSKLRKKKF
jgi:hypothetical protein